MTGCRLDSSIRDWKRVLIALIAGSIGLTATDASAQTPDELVDRVVAVVGDTVVLQSEIQQQIFRLQAQGVELPNDPAGRDRFLDQVLEQKINELLVVIHAREAGITVSEDEVNEAVDQRLAQIRRSFQSEQQFNQALQQAGLTLPEFRIQLSEQTRAELLTQRYLQQQMSQLRPTPVSEDEIQEQFETQKASLGPKPSSVTLRQVILNPQPSEEAWLEAREVAEQALSRLRSGESFARLAREYSDDRATRDDGGELGWVGRGELLPSFEEALFAMSPGETSDLVRTEIGYHVIRLERVRGNERFARHILIQAEISEQDLEATHQRAQEVADALRNGADIDSLIRLHADPQERATLTDFPRDRLPEEYREALADAGPGDVVGPVRVPTSGLLDEKWAVIQVRSIDPGGEWTLGDVRDSFRRQIQQQKMLQQLMDQLRKSTYIDVRI